MSVGLFASIPEAYRSRSSSHDAQFGKAMRQEPLPLPEAVKHTDQAISKHLACLDH